MALKEDIVELTLGDKTVVIAESYQVRASVFTQPAQFGLSLGHGNIAAELLRQYPPNTRFALAINGRKFQTGFIDTVSTSDSNGATSVTFQGRDVMSRLVDSFLPSEESFQEATYVDLVRKQLDGVGLEGTKIQASNAANRKAVTGGKVIELAPAEIEAEHRIDEQTELRNEIPATKRVVYQTLKAKLGTRRYEFLKTQLERAGLFLWAAGDGGVVIAWPQAFQTPIAKLVRQRGSTRQPGSILRHSYTHSITRRYTNCIVYGHGGGRNFGRTKNRGEFVDEEMMALFGGGTRKLRPLVIHDDDAKSQKQAEFLARRRIVEANRAAWELTYDVAGHGTPDGSAIWAPDTVVEVDDRELGITGQFYVEDVVMSRQPQTVTTLRLMKPEHVRGLRPE